MRIHNLMYTLFQAVDMRPESRCRWVPNTHTQIHTRPVWVGYEIIHLTLGTGRIYAGNTHFNHTRQFIRPVFVHLPRLVAAAAAPKLTNGEEGRILPWAPLPRAVHQYLVLLPGHLLVLPCHFATIFNEDDALPRAQLLREAHPKSPRNRPRPYETPMSLRTAAGAGAAAL